MIAAAKNARGPSLEEFKCNHEWALRDRLKCFVNLESVPWPPEAARLKSAPLTAAKLRKKEAPMRSTALSAELVLVEAASRGAAENRHARS
jgi:hypothetical protein